MKTLVPFFNGVMLYGFSMGVLIFSNSVLILSFSYAINDTMYNMTSGCLLCEPEPCAKRLVFYGQSSLLMLYFWSSVLFMNEVIIGVLIGLFIFNAHRYFNRHHHQYRLAMIEAFPSIKLPVEEKSSNDDEMLTTR